MKQIVIQRETTTVNIDRITNKSIVGIKYVDTNEKAIVIRNEDNTYSGYTGEDQSLALEGKWWEDTIKDYVTTAISDGSEAFVFDTFKDLFSWVLKD